MAKTGIDLPPIPQTGIDTGNSQQIIALLELHSETNKVNTASKDKLTEQLF